MTTHPTDDEQEARCDDRATPDSCDQSSLLARTIEGEIIPRLMMTVNVLPNPLSLEQARDVSGLFEDNEELIAELIRLLLNHDARVSVEFLSGLRSRGATLRDMYLDLLAPAARQLGVMWEEDTANFAQVTVGVSRLHQILLQFSPLFCAEAPDNHNGRTAAIFALPGESHTFGIFMVVEFFRRAGWTVYSGTLSEDSAVKQLLSTHEVDVFGVSVSAERHLTELPERIARLRAASRNPEMKVICGGHAFLRDSTLHTSIGADGFAEDGRRAVELANTLVKINAATQPGTA
ncbi:MAG: cobalamin-dependent protein [Pseudomonadota bacterium]